MENPTSFLLSHDESRYPAPEHESHERNTAVFGFWVYLMSDCFLFASLFATYVVLRAGTFSGPGPSQIFSLPYALSETLILLTSSFTAGLGVLAMQAGRKRYVLLAFGATLLFGLAFLGLEIHEFVSLVSAGHGPSASGFLSAYFTLVGTHGLHVALGSIWMLFMLIEVMRSSLSSANVRRLTMLSMFWHFLDIIWICIFTVVYLLPFIV